MKRIKVILQLIYDLLILKYNFFIVTSQDEEPITYCKNHWPEESSKTISEAITSRLYINPDLIGVNTRMTKKKVTCLKCGKNMKPEYDSIAKKITGYIYSCKCSPKIGMSIG